MDWPGLKKKKKIEAKEEKKEPEEEKKEMKYSDKSLKKLRRFLTTEFKFGSSIDKMMLMVETLCDDKADFFTRARAVVTFVIELNFAMEKLSRDNHNLQKLLGALGKIGDVFQAFKKVLNEKGAMMTIFNALKTLYDPKSSDKDKALAMVEIAKNWSSANAQRKEVTELLKMALGKNKNQKLVMKNYSKLLENLSTENVKAVQKNINGKLLKDLDKNTLKKLGSMVDDTGESGLKVLKYIDSPDQLKTMLKAMDEVKDVGSKKAFANMLEEAAKEGGPKALRGALAPKELGKLKQIMGILEVVPEKDFALKTLLKYDEDTLKLLVKNGIKEDPLLGKTLTTMAKNPDAAVSPATVKKILGVLGNVVEFLGLKAGKKTMKIAMKNLLKIIPALGAMPSLLDAYKMTSIAAKTKSSEIRFLALLNGFVNGLDGVLSILEAFPPFQVAIPVGIGLAVVELVLGVIVDAMWEQEKAGTLAKPSKELRAVIGAIALLLHEPGMALLLACYGPSGLVGVLTDTVQVGGKFAALAVEKLCEIATKGVEKAFDHLVAGIDLITDVIENPSKALNAIKNKAASMWNTTKKAANWAKDTAVKIGKKATQAAQQGVAWLRDFANNPGKYMLAAGESLTRVAVNTIRWVNDARKEMCKKLTTLAVDGLNKLKKVSENVKKMLKDCATAAVKAGAKVKDAFKWMLKNPGLASRLFLQGLGDLVLNAKKLAEQAWDFLCAQGAIALDKLKEIAKKASEWIARGIKKGATLCVWVVQHPGEALKYAGDKCMDALTSMAETVDRKMQEASDFCAEKCVELLRGIKHIALRVLGSLDKVLRALQKGAGKVVASFVRMGTMGARKIGELIKWAGEKFKNCGTCFVKGLRSLCNGTAEVVKEAIKQLHIAVVGGIKDFTKGAKKMVQDLRHTGKMAVNMVHDVVKAGRDVCLRVFNQVLGSGMKNVEKAVKCYTESACVVGKVDIVTNLYKLGGGIQNITGCGLFAHRLDSHLNIHKYIQPEVLLKSWAGNAGIDNEILYAFASSSPIFKVIDLVSIGLGQLVQDFGEIFADPTKIIDLFNCDTTVTVMKGVFDASIRSRKVVKIMKDRGVNPAFATIEGPMTNFFWDCFNNRRTNVYENFKTKGGTFTIRWQAEYGYVSHTITTTMTKFTPPPKRHGRKVAAW